MNEVRHFLRNKIGKLIIRDNLRRHFLKEKLLQEDDSQDDDKKLLHLSK